MASDIVNCLEDLFSVVGVRVQRKTSETEKNQHFLSSLPDLILSLSDFDSREATEVFRLILFLCQSGKQAAR